MTSPSEETSEGEIPSTTLAQDDGDDFSVGDAPDDEDDSPVCADNDTPNPVAKKRRKLGDPSADMTTLTTSIDDHYSPVSNERKEEMLDLAKAKLSKWAARLFDPDRPRGLVEPPKTIPLNDEFLTAFGKREKKFDEAMGRQQEIDNSNLDDENDSSDAAATDQSVSQAENEKEKSSTEGCKVKITNLAYATKYETLQAACEAYGPCEEVNLLMDKEKAGMNVGRAYVTFETPEAAEECLEKLSRLDGRTLRVSIAIDNPDRSRKPASAPARYWETDISTKCFRCGEVGHMAGDCPNEAKQSPCPLCAIPGHEMYACPLSTICFNCGLPGHVIRDCGQRRLPKRMACGTCFQSGHHRYMCRRAAYEADTKDAKCMVCGELGHFMCKDMKWFFGLDGVSCFNCGQQGHHGLDCKRPSLDACSREPRVGEQEVERAEAFSLVDELNKQINYGDSSSRASRERGRRGDRDYNRGRAKSQPPPRDYGRGYDDRGGNERRGGQRGYSSQSQRSDSGEGGRGYREAGRQYSNQGKYKGHR